MISNEQHALDKIASMRTYAQYARDLMENGSARKRPSGPHALSERILPTARVTMLPLHILEKERIEHGLGVNKLKKRKVTVV